MDNKKPIALWVVLICLATLVFGVGGHSLWTPDEPREAAIAWSTVRGSSWFIPQLAGEPFVEKPPLYYWLSAGMMKTFGALTGPTTAARSLSALCAALTLLLVWVTAKRYLGEKAISSVLILATSYGFFYAGHWIIIDPLLMLLITASILSLFTGLDREKPYLLLAGYLSAALAFLTKGFVAWALLAAPALTLLILYWKSVRGRLPLHILGLALCLGPVAAWMAVFHLRGGEELWRQWFIDNQIGRFLGKTHHLGHIHGPFYYLSILPGVLMPWTPLLLGWLAGRGWRGASGPGRKFLRVSLAWAGGGLLILTLSGTKRDIYLFPLLPAFAFLLAARREIAGWVRVILRVICWILLPVLTIAVFFRPLWVGTRLTPGWGLSLPLLLCAAAGWWVFHLYRDKIIYLTAGLTGLFYLGMIFSAFPLIDHSKNYEPATRAIARRIPPGERSRVCGWHMDESTRAQFYYYTGLTFPEARDKFHPQSSLKNLRKILKGEDRRYDLVITLIKHHRRFPPPGIELEAKQIIARQKMGVHRELLLIRTETRNGQKFYERIKPVKGN